MVRSGALSLWFRLFTCFLFLLALTSCEKGKPGKKKTDPGKIGSVTLAAPASATNVPLYSKVELLVTFATAPSTTLQYDPDPARGGMKLDATFTGPGGPFTVPGFYDGTSWRIRFAPMGIGKYKYTVSYQDPDSKGTWSEGEFTCVASTFKGFAQIAGRYLKMSNGTMFFPVGHNNGWQTEVRVPALDTMATQGENLLAFWQAVPWTTTGARAPIENNISATAVSTYNQSACTYLDTVVADAELKNVFLQPTIWSHGELRQQPHSWATSEGWWSNNGYSIICATPLDFFVMDAGGGTATEQWRLQQNFLRYLFARYGYSRAILNWIVIAEIDGTSGYDDALNGGPAQVAAWLQAVRGYWNQLDFYRRNGTGQTPLAAFATDWAAIDTSGFFPALGYEPGLDTVSTDTYLRGNNLMAASVAGIETGLLRGPGNPCFHGEFGGTAPITLPTAGQISHNGLWAATSSGACMTPLQWCDAGSWVLLTQSPDGAAIQNQLKCLGAFMANVDYLGEASITSEQIVTPTLTQSGWSTHTTDRGFGWIQHGGIPISTTITGLTNGSYEIRWYNVAGAAPAQTLLENVTFSGGTLPLTYPSTVSDLAFKFIRTGALIIAPPSSPAVSSSTRAVPPPTEDGPPPDTTEEPPAIPPSDSTGAKETPPDPEEPAKPPTEF